MGVLGENWWWVWAVVAKMVFLGGKNEVSADFSVNFQKSAYIAYDCTRGRQLPRFFFMRNPHDK
ncbi:hypothetical protein NA56DRAFT_647027 [Hyaloscypha hepaticicola]|uniref:Uncharacterized protein n=1 Tax=Hyaloscypha hepaticicola TaxID=2082293 RepID=A0A2J6Q0B6_9HELO|nr:hypothetical protein NA56DRAFT_647027 [Hyaloscypha hepaticicola]